MFDIPKKYSADSAVETKAFITQDMKKPDKERIRENLLSARLIWQIAGEDISSLVNKNYNCSVIMGLDINLKTIKDAAYLAGIVQQMVKAPCVVRFYDHAEEVYSFAHKRISRTDAMQVVIEHRVQTPTLSLVFPDKTAEKLKRHLAFGALLNRADKLSLYLEAMVKTFIVSNPKLYSGIDELLDHKLWYNREGILELFGQLLELQRLNEALKAERLPGKRAKTSGKIKKLIGELSNEAKR